MIDSKNILFTEYEDEEGYHINARLVLSADMKFSNELLDSDAADYVINQGKKTLSRALMDKVYGDIRHKLIELHLDFACDIPLSRFDRYNEAFRGTINSIPL